MGGRRGTIARWTESPPRTRDEQYQVLYREYINGVIFEYRGKGDSRADARLAAAVKFRAAWGRLPHGYVEPTAG